MRILVAGRFAAHPEQGGATWAALQYVRGLRLLGHDVIAVEPVAALRQDVVDYFNTLGLERAALLVSGGEATVGLSYDEIAGFHADALLNLSGVLHDLQLTAPVPRRVYLDLDPLFTQGWHAQGIDMGIAGHTHCLTVGQTLDRIPVPLDRRWTVTLPPVVLDEWPVSDRLEVDAFTTVGNWRSYGSLEWAGSHYGQRAHSARRLLELPGLTQQRLWPAFAIDPGETADLDALAAHGWQLHDPVRAAATPDAYRRFVSGSKGELGIAKAGYVDSRCGWFSDRSACYLAAGRPVVAQDTGFARTLPVGEGLLAYATPADCAAALDRVCDDYERHRRAARAIAEEHLDSRRVLTQLFEAVM